MEGIALCTSSVLPWNQHGIFTEAQPKAQLINTRCLHMSWLRSSVQPTSAEYGYGHLPVTSGYKWDYTFYKWGYKYL